MKISGSIYSDKKRNLKETIEDLAAHQVDMLHVDCNDDLSVFDDIQLIRKWSNLPIDLHIITESPAEYFPYLRDVPVEYITFQYEELPNKLIIPDDIQGQIGLALTTPTSISVFDEYSDFDFILFMATIPGESGGVFDPENFRKIRTFKKKYPTKNVHVDGGVNGEVSFILRNMGVHSSVSGSFLFKGVSVGKALMDLTKRNIHSQFKIKDFMIPREECPIIQLNELTFKGVLEEIEEGKLGFTLIEDDNKFEGIISNADVRKGLIKNFDNIVRLDVTGMINSNPITIDADANVDMMLKLVRNYDAPILYLPVIDVNKKIAGIVTFLNLIKGEI